MAAAGRATVPTPVPAADWVFAAVAADPRTALTAAVVGPGGTGKSRLLDRIAEAYAAAGVEPVRVRAGERPVPDPDRVLLVDDAHRLDTDSVAVLRAAADSGGARLVVAYRSWPRSAELAGLGASLARDRAVIVLGHLGRTEVAARVAALLGCPPPDPLVDLVHEQSGGLPALTDVVTVALRDSGRFDPRHPQRFRRPERITVSAGRAERLRYQMDALAPDVHRLLQAMALGATLDADQLGAVLDVDPSGLSDTVEAARATGLVTASGRLVPVIQNIVAQLIPALDSREMQRRLADFQLRRGGSVLDAGARLLGTGASGARVAAVLEAAGDEALRQTPELAADLFAGAVAAGGPAAAMAGRRARVCALAGRFDEALRLADEAISDPSAADRDEATAVLAAVLAHRGLPARSAQLYRRLPTGAVLAVPALIGVGDLDGARAAVAGADDEARVPTLVAEAAALTARGMLASVTGSSTAALSQLVRASAMLEPAGPTVLLPDTPNALAALVAMQRGELSAAESALRSGVAAKLGGRPGRIRNALLFGWLAMMRGDLAVARRSLERATEAASRLEPRDELWAAALAGGLARREDVSGPLAAALVRARDALNGQPVDLYTLLPLGELAVAAAQLGGAEWIGPHLAEADELLHRLGDPPLWTVPLCWSRLLAAVAGADVDEARRQEKALDAAAGTSPFAGVLADAGHCWLDVVAGSVDREPVEAAARRLHGIGLAWEAARLAGQAALRTTDRRTMAALHACARGLYGGGETRPDEAAAPAAPPASTPTPAITPATAPVPARPGPAGRPPADGVLTKATSLLSEREFEVSQLILEGLTYKQIGQRLYISAKTVEHHVARIRHRLGASTREELFGQLRPLVPAGHS